MAQPTAKVPVKTGDTLSAIAKANNTTVAKILADPRNAVIADRVKAGTTAIFNGSSVAIPPKAPTPAASATPAAEIARIKEIAAANPVAPNGSTYNQRVVEAIKSGTQATTDVNANPIKTPTQTTEWVKAGTVETLNGPVDVDATGKAKDGSVPIAKSADEKDKNKFEPVGKLLRYIAGSKPGSRIPIYADGKGGEFQGEESNNPVNPGSTGFEDTGIITLASNTFANTLALLMGENEAGQPWVEELRQLTQGFINTGSDVESATNLALREAKAQGKASKFVKRFDAIFKLQDRLNAGETVQVPTIAEYVNSEQELGNVLRGVGLGELATQEFSAKVFGDANKSVSEATDLIANVFNAIDNAPDALKRDLEVGFPGLDRTAIAKAMLLGKEGALELTKKVRTIEQVSAAKSQGVLIDSATGSSLAAGGADYTSSLGKFETVKQLERGQQLGKMSSIDFTQQDAIASAFQSSASANEKIRKINEEEANRFSSRSGRLNSQDRAQGQV